MNVLTSLRRNLIFDKQAKGLSILSFWLYAGLVAVVWWLSGRMPPEFPLFYSLPRGKEQLATIADVKNMMMLLGSLVLINYVMAAFLNKNWKVLMLMMLWTSILSILLVAYTLARIYILVV